MRVLVTDHWIALLRGHLDLRDWVSPTGELAITAISMGELMHGAYKSVQVAENLAQIDALLAAVTILPCDEGTTRRLGLLKAQLEQAGMRLSDLDLHIASIVLQCGAPLVTPNQSYFIRVPGLVIEDWLK